jgi:hypothetical protein
LCRQPECRLLAERPSASVPQLLAPRIHAEVCECLGTGMSIFFGESSISKLPFNFSKGLLHSYLLTWRSSVRSLLAFFIIPC